MSEQRGPAIRAVLVDVGGTLWPDGWIPPTREEDEGRADLLCDAFPTLTASSAAALVRRLHRRAAEVVPAEAPSAGTVQRTDELVDEALAELGLARTAEAAEAIRAAMGAFRVTPGRLFDGAEELLVVCRELGLRTVIVSNTFWRDSEGYRRDFAALGVAQCIDGWVTSLDVGFRKPHRAMFDAALGHAGCGGSECVFVGNSEPLDIEPARALGMRTIRVAIEEPPPDRSAAEAVATSLHEAASILKSWV